MLLVASFCCHSSASSKEDHNQLCLCVCKYGAYADDLTEAVGVLLFERQSGDKDVSEIEFPHV